MLQAKPSGPYFDSTTNTTYIGLIRRGEGNVMIIFGSLTLAMLLFGIVAVALLRMTGSKRPRYGYFGRQSRGGYHAALADDHTPADLA